MGASHLPAQQPLLPATSVCLGLLMQLVVVEGIASAIAKGKAAEMSNKPQLLKLLKLPVYKMMLIKLRVDGFDKKAVDRNRDWVCC